MEVVEVRHTGRVVGSALWASHGDVVGGAP